MAKRLVKQFAGGAEYRFNKQFLQEVQKRTAEYKIEGYSQRAAEYRDTINEAFIKEQNIDPPLGFILAMSRSKFVPAGNQNGEEGLWRISKESGYVKLLRRNVRRQKSDRTDTALCGDCDFGLYESARQ